MEHAPLRPVPARPAGQIDPATALREVGAWLPTLAPVAARALALVVLTERPRTEVAETLGVSEAELGALLASARKELRQTIVGLGGSGWCERAEGLISDRLDGALADRDARRLDVHLRNCTRCVEHERRLVQATDALIAGLGAPARSPAPATGEPPPPLVGAAPADDGGEESASPGREGVPETESESSPPTAGRPAAFEAIALPESAPSEANVEAPPAPASDEIAAAAEVLVASRTRRHVAAAVVWNSLTALALLLSLATIALTIAGIMGAEL